MKRFVAVLLFLASSVFAGGTDDFGVWRTKAIVQAFDEVHPTGHILVIDLPARSEAQARTRADLWCREGLTVDDSEEWGPGATITYPVHTVKSCSVYEAQ